MNIGIFRPMTWDDITPVVALEQVTFSSPWSREAFETELASNVMARYVVLEVEGKVAGYAGMWIVVNEAHIMNVAVEAPLRGRGLGELLMRHMLEVAAKNGAERMTLEVRRSNMTARKLYDKLGFVESGVRAGYYSDNGEDALLLWLDNLAPSTLI